MPILPHILLPFLTLYWAILAEFFSACFYTNLLARCQTHLLVRLANQVDFTPLDTACAAYQHQTGAGTSATYPVAVLVRAILVKALYALSYRALEERLLADLIVRWFVGLPCWGDTPDHTTLARFESWVKQHHGRVYEDTVLRQIDQHFPQSRTLNQIGDTYAMRANAAEEDLVRRVRHTCEILLGEAVKTMPALLTPTVSRFPWHELFGVPREAVPFQLPEATRQQQVTTALVAADTLRQRFTAALASFSRQAYPDVRQWLGYLEKILADEVVFLPEPDLTGCRVHVRTPQERRQDEATTFRLISATDPDATYRMHGEKQEQITFGYNIQVAASMDGFIRETQAYTGATPDQVGVAPLIATQKEHLGQVPPKLLYDQAAGTGKIRAQVTEASDGQTQLVAKLPPYAQRTPRYGPYDFTLAEDGESLTCPAGKVSTTAYASQSGDGRTFRFFACQCWLDGEPPTQMKKADLTQRCPLWEQCRETKQGPGSQRQVFISTYRQEVLAAQTYNQTETFKTEMKQRPLIERIVFELTNYYGARRCRGRGLQNADWQAKMAAVAYNLNLWMRKLSRLATAHPHGA
jgi:hypothetical protein